MDSMAYEPVPYHFKVPHGVFLLEATAVSVDVASNNVYVFNRGNHPVCVFDKHGNFLRHFGNDTPFNGTEVCQPTRLAGSSRMRWRGSQYVRPHSVHVDPESNVWLVDDAANTVTKCAPSGERLMVLCPNGVVLTKPSEVAAIAGTVRPPAERQGGGLFNAPTDVAVHAASGDIFVTDGYGNARCHRFDKAGKHLLSFGRSGTGPGEFNCPHSVCILPDGQRILICDRENNRVQIFGLDGEFVSQHFVHRPVSATTGRDGAGRERLFIAELWTHFGQQQGEGREAHMLDGWAKDIGNKIGIYDADSMECLGKIGASSPGERPDQFLSLHSVDVDSEGSIYAAAVSFCECGVFQKPHPREMVSLVKWRLAQPVREEGNASKRVKRGE